MSEEVRVKRIRPFPFEGQITIGAQSVPVRIHKMTLTGLLLEANAFLKVGQRYTLQFTLPVLKSQVTADVVAVKTWDQFAAPISKGGTVLKMIELHFKDVPGESHANVVAFLKKIGVVSNKDK
jgi:hypothetical protein